MIVISYEEKVKLGRGKGAFTMLVERAMWSGGGVPSTVSTRTGLSINQNFITEFYLYFTIRLP